MEKRRRLPVGIQSFETVRRDSYVYVDKTDLVWQLANGDRINCLCRPTRFGKSLLLNTLHSYFEGRKWLFKGLAIERKETVWDKYAVIHLDMSLAGEKREDAESYLNCQLGKYENYFGVPQGKGQSIAARLTNVITTASKKTGRGVVLLVDAIDTPYIYAWGTAEQKAYSELWETLLHSLYHAQTCLRFVILAGVTDFIGKLCRKIIPCAVDITFAPRFATLCGLTHEEVRRDFVPELLALAKQESSTVTEMSQRLQNLYGGYRFSGDNCAKVYCPFDILSALSTRDITNYWGNIGDYKLLPHYVTDIETTFHTFEGCRLPLHSAACDADTHESNKLFMLLSGFLTITEKSDEEYVLDYPNTEVRTILGIRELMYLGMQDSGKVNTALCCLKSHICNGNDEQSRHCLEILTAAGNYSSEKLKTLDDKNRNDLLTSAVFCAIGMDGKQREAVLRQLTDINI